MHKVIAEDKTFSKILVAVDELKTSSATTNRAIDYAVNIAQDYDARLIILHVIRADVRVHGINPPRHVIEMKKEAEASFAKMIEKIHQSAAKRNEETLQIKTLTYHRHCCDDEVVPIKVLMNSYFSLLKLWKT